VEHGDTECAEEFDEQFRYFRILDARVETKKSEEQGYWDRAADYAELAGDLEKAKTYTLLNDVIRAFHTP